MRQKRRQRLWQKKEWRHGKDKSFKEQTNGVSKREWRSATHFTIKDEWRIIADFESCYLDVDKTLKRFARHGLSTSRVTFWIKAHGIKIKLSILLRSSSRLSPAVFASFSMLVFNPLPCHLSYHSKGLILTSTPNPRRYVICHSTM